MTKTVVAIYDSMNKAENAANQLLNNGFSNENIDVSAGDKYSEDTHAGESGISRFFKNLFGADDEKSDRYIKIGRQGYVVTVYARSDEEANRASKLLDDYGAMDVDENYHKQLSDESYYEKNRNYNDTEKPDEERKEIKKDVDISDENKTFPVIEEDIKVGKREIATGGVRIRSRIVEKPVEENLRLREEHIHVERNKVDRPATEEELNNFKDGTVEFTEHAEIPDVQKRSNVVEEVSLEKKVDHRDEVVRDKIRKTEVDVENIEPGDRRNKNRDL